MNAAAPAHEPLEAQARFVAYHQPSLRLQALRTASAKRAPEFNLVPAASVDARTALIDIILIPIPTDEPLDIPALLQPFEAIRAQRPNIPVIAVLPTCDPMTAGKLIDHRVTGLITADSTIEITVAALRFALAGGAFAPPRLLEGKLHANPPATPPTTLRAETLELTNHNETTFTPREIEVLHRLRQGLQNKIIAYELGISESTVKVHLRNVMKKLHASNRTQVAFMLRRLPHLNTTSQRGRDYPPQ